MREIKFRAWAVASQKMFYPDTDDGWGLINGTLPPLPNTILEQYTGLKDKNGKMIYEGDIVKQLHLTCTIIFDIGGFCFESNNCYDRMCLHNLARETERWEIIGNIHEEAKLENRKTIQQ